jgi:hypothetical protein
MNSILSYYGHAETALYFLIGLLCALRARTASGAYGVCVGLFVLWTFPAMYFDAYLGRDAPGIVYLVIAPLYATASPLMHFLIRRVWPRAPEPPVLPSHQNAFVRLCGALGRVAGRASKNSHHVRED